MVTIFIKSDAYPVQTHVLRRTVKLQTSLVAFPIKAGDLNIKYYLSRHQFQGNIVLTNLLLVRTPLMFPMKPKYPLLLCATIPLATLSLH